MSASHRASNRFAFTLLEVLTVVAVLTIIAAIVAPVIVRSKDAARKTNDLSNMRQLGVAAAMYLDSYGFSPSGCTNVVDAGLAPKELCAGMLDPYREGLANRLVKGLANNSTYYSGLEATYRLSFPGLREFGVPDYLIDDVVQQDMAVGWLVDLAPSDNIPEIEPYLSSSLTGRYRRLLLDGSVQWRHHQLVNIRKGGPKGWMPIMLFADVDEPWVISKSDFLH
jgi:prepilin-type N-terminal cleavage/methylation domain-containing protein